MFCLRIILAVLAVSFSNGALAMRSDSFEIRHTLLDLKIRNLSAKKISGAAIHSLHFKVNTDYVLFDLRQLQTDSVSCNGNAAVFLRQGEKLRVSLGRSFSAGDSCLIRIAYGGTPAADPGGWGGFYFSGDYAFNLGVGFSVHPHSFGRAWYPCVDEFPMKTAYSFRIETDSLYTAACNGVLTGVEHRQGVRVWNYREPLPMSAYLVSVSVSRFAVLSDTFRGMQSDFPIGLYCRPADSSKVRASFQKLPDAIRAFEQAFGPQVFSKVGYNFVPFNAGAMEHAGNITYPAAFANGSLTYETLMAHELAHHWWGNHVTCHTEGDMWLNEGWASYCEHLFTQFVYGNKAYRESILRNHTDVLRFAHIRDANLFSLTDIPKEYTYGAHVYKKGADVVHSLRSVLGDSVFFAACRLYQDSFALGTAASSDAEEVFAKAGGGQTARDFFSDWVYEKGFPHARITWQAHSGNGPYRLRFAVGQQSRFRSLPYKNLPMEVFFFKDRRQWVRQKVVLNAASDTFEAILPFKPVFVCLDFDEKLSDAISDRVVQTDSAATFDLPETFSKILTRRLADSALFRVEHHWVGPEKYKVRSPYPSDYRYYTLDGIWDDSALFDLELVYDGRQGGAGSGTGYLDHSLIKKTEDSLTVLYRAYPGDHWRKWEDLSFVYGNKLDKQGRVLIRNARRGDYVFAMYDHSLGLSGAVPAQPSGFEIFPNPAGLECSLRFASEAPGLIEIFNSAGVCVKSLSKNEGCRELTIDTRSLAAGMYTVAFNGAGANGSQTLVLAR